jgi:tRNA A-37 threonylcarbamoyl transferase component Bud32/tetratricopeptide (TPR) repeat protein
MNRESQRLLDTAASVADGRVVDWLDLEHAADEDERRLLEQLRVVAGIVDVHRSTPEEVPNEQEVARLRDRVLAVDAAPGPDVPDTLDAQTWGHLELQEQVGEGTFGEVYRARDTHLDRDVALKLFRADAGDGRLADRVTHEGRILARVRHPNVVTVYGVEEREARVGMWMEFVRGNTLEALLARQGPFSAREAAVIGQDLCRAVAAVHRAGLLHRDIKAQNVMREHGGRVVLMDFGAGCLFDPNELPASGQTTGTPMYLAPELVAGGDASVESDIYSLGVLLYHLVTQSYPVRATSLDGLRAAHAAGLRTRLHDARPDLTDGFVAVVERAMDPDPQRRFHSAGELQTALARSLGVETPTPQPGAVEAVVPGLEAPTSRRAWPAWLRSGRSLAVLAAVALVALVAVWGLRSRSGAAGGATNLLVVKALAPASSEDQYLASGLTSALYTALGRLDLPVRVASPSAMDRIPAETPTAQVLERLNADVMADGRVHQTADGAAEVNVRLTRAGAGAPFWTATFTRPRAETPRLQDDIAIAIAEALRIRPRSAAREAARVLPEAYEAYLRGRFELSKNRAQQAVPYLNQARSLQPDFAAAYAALGQAYFRQTFRSPRSEWPALVASAREASRQALLLDPDVSEAYGVLADISFVEDWDWPAAESQFRRALELNPTDDMSRVRQALFLSARRRLPEALEVIAEGRKLNPLSPTLAGTAAIIRYFARDFRGAMDEANQGVTLDSSHIGPKQSLCRIYRATGRHRDALKPCRAIVDDKRSRATDPTLLWQDREWHSLQAELAVALINAGRRGEAQPILAEMLRAREASADFVMPEYLAFIEIALGHTDRAMDWLNEAVAERSRAIVYLAVDPRFDPIRRHPRYPEFLAQLGLTPSGS